MEIINIIPGQEKESKKEELIICEKALKLYIKLLNEKGSIIKFNPYDVKRLADMESLRYGMPGCGHTKLCYDNLDGNHEFHLFDNGADPKKFAEWDELVAKIFQENGLNYRKTSGS